MKRFFWLFALAGLGLTACDKTEDDGPTVILAEFSLSQMAPSLTQRRIADPEISPISVLRNTSNREVKLVWRRISGDLPSGWELAVCDDVACHAPSVARREMTLPPDAVVDMKITFRHNEVEGRGEASLLIFDPQDSAATVRTVTFTAVAE